MEPLPRRRHIAALTAMAAVVVGSFVVAAPADAADGQPPLRLVAGASSITISRYEGEGVPLELGTHIVAGNTPFEVWVKRQSYSDPITASRIERAPRGTRAVPLPPEVVTEFGGLVGFTHVTLRDAAGTVVVDRDENFCPNGVGARTRPDAPSSSPYPRTCPQHPFTLGAVWGIQAGWSTPAGAPWWQRALVDLPDGQYTAVVRVNAQYVAVFGIPADQASATVTLTVRTFAPELRERASPATASPPSAVAPATAMSLTSVARASKRVLPDLRALPAWGVEIGVRSEPTDRDYLSFSATVWTAGRSPLVVEGFRRTDAAVMDAYQYFYDAQGNQTGYASVGTMEWDSRDGHEHWHFTDFARYRLLDAGGQVAVRSGKEAFCLANTDAIDYTIAGANWRPENTDLHTACGDQASLSVRQVLDVGSGDTYAQYLPGQSFDITDLPNGIYHIEIVANPDHRLHEIDLTNNTTVRTVILGGVAGARTIAVPPVGRVDA